MAACFQPRVAREGCCWGRADCGTARLFPSPFPPAPWRGADANTNTCYPRTGSSARGGPAPKDVCRGSLRCGGRRWACGGLLDASWEGFLRPRLARPPPRCPARELSLCPVASTPSRSPVLSFTPAPAASHQPGRGLMSLPIMLSPGLKAARHSSSSQTQLWAQGALGSAGQPGRWPGSACPVRRPREASSPRLGLGRGRPPTAARCCPLVSTHRTSRVRPWERMALCQE